MKKKKKKVIDVYINGKCVSTFKYSEEIKEIKIIVDDKLLCSIDKKDMDNT